MSGQTKEASKKASLPQIVDILARIALEKDQEASVALKAELAALLADPAEFKVTEQPADGETA